MRSAPGAPASESNKCLPASQAQVRLRRRAPRRGGNNAIGPDCRLLRGNHVPVTQSLSPHFGREDEELQRGLGLQTAWLVTEPAVFFADDHPLFD